MSTLYDISDNYKILLDMGDEIPPEQLVDTLELIESEFDDKAINVIKVMKAVTGDVDAIDAEIKRLQGRKKTFVNRVDNLKEYLRSNMIKMGKRKIQTDLFTLSLRKGGQSTYINNIDDLPKSLQCTLVTADKAEIKKLLLEGKKVIGCKLVTGEDSLMIK